jgi:Lon protease-like protein
VWDLQQDTSPITSIVFTTAGTTVLQILQHRKSLLHALSEFLEANNLKADWEGIENAPNEALVNALAMMSPYGTAEKQALLEAPDLKTRAEILVAATEIELAKKTTGGETPLQ